VEKDGYYDVRRADTTGDAFVLYDPARGTNDYFIVENRERTGGTYDQSASDNGLVIWRADDSKFGNGSLRAIEIMRVDGATKPGLQQQHLLRRIKWRRLGSERLRDAAADDDQELAGWHWCPRICSRDRR
jgi:hypothetical protein